MAPEQVQNAAPVRHPTANFCALDLADAGGLLYRQQGEKGRNLGEARLRANGNVLYIPCNKGDSSLRETLQSQRKCPAGAEWFLCPWVLRKEYKKEEKKTEKENSLSTPLLIFQ